MDVEVMYKVWEVESVHSDMPKWESLRAKWPLEDRVQHTAKCEFIDRIQHPAEPDFADMPVDSPRSLNPDTLWTPVWSQACSLRLEPTRQYSAFFTRVFSPTLVRFRRPPDAQLLTQKLLPVFARQEQGQQIDLRCHREVDWSLLATPTSSFWDTDPEDSPSLIPNRRPSPPPSQKLPSAEKPTISNPKRKLDDTSSVDALTSNTQPRDGPTRRITRSCKRRRLAPTDTKRIQ
ncbi:hypothetical protein NQ176_g6584 [Zarea fungicola]|uniref:Uncharacterized protein n=1 Tax=Zarea fungicola TaxID=93591 RepID=A0ACC1N335_9HYPO|nr:hypothetical protein NQ176_g6584 [Lecanicillium fungicola]